MRNPHLHAGELGVSEAGALLHLSYATVLALVADGTLRGGIRQVPRKARIVPWSTAPTHNVHFVDSESVAAFVISQPGRLRDLQQRRARMARAVRLGQRRARAAARAVVGET